MNESKETREEKTANDPTIDLNDFQKEVEKLLALLNDRQTGLTTWHEFMKEQLENIHKFTSRALGK